MAQSSTLYRFKITVSDVDRGVYETLELRVAMHPSESAPYFLTRVIAYVLNVQEGIEFSPGISDPDQAAIYIKDLTGEILTWIDIGNPSARRLHKASKASQNVKVYTYRDLSILVKEMEGQEVYRLGEIEVYVLKNTFLDSLAETLERDNTWEFLHTEGELSITTRSTTVTGEITLHRLTP